MPTPIGVERAKQALPLDRLGQAQQARHRAFLLDQKRRTDRPGGIVEGDDEVEIAPQRRNPAMGRAVLKQQHSRQRPPRPLLAVGAPTLGFRHQPGRLQRRLGHRVAQLVMVPLHQLLVEVLHREVAVALPIKFVHPLELARRRTARRYLADPPIAQPLDAVLLVANAQPAEVPPRHAQQLPGLLARQQIIVPFAAGGPVDVVARLVAQRMAVILGQNVIVEDRAGGGGVIGAKAVANAEPDGYTLLFGNVSTLAVIPAVARNKDYDPAKNFAPVAKVFDSPEVLVVDRSFPARTVQELVTIARNNPGKLNFGSSGFGNATHLAAEWFKAKTAVDIVHVPYKGLSEVVTGVLAGQVTFVFDPGWSIACSGGDQREAVRAAPGAADHDR